MDKKHETAEEEIKPKTSDTILYGYWICMWNAGYRQQKIDNMQPMRSNIYIHVQSIDVPGRTYTYTYIYHHYNNQALAQKLSLYPENP